jgi:glycosyltransferase involved in cell wall biosynthesis
VRKILFVTWDGQAQAYLRSLFIPIFEAWKRLGVETEILQFSFAEASQVEKTQAIAERAGIRYEHCPIPSTARKLLAPALVLDGARRIHRAVERRNIDAVMPRSLIPATMVLAARATGMNAPIVFDADGLMADERVDFAGWSKSSPPYRVLKYVERTMVRRATATIVRTSGARALLRHEAGQDSGGDSIFVVPNLSDPDRFTMSDEAERRKVRRSLSIPRDAFVPISVGSLGPQYLPEVQSQLVRELKGLTKSVHWIVLTGHDDIASRLVEQAGLEDCQFTIMRVPATEVPRYIGASDVGLALRSATPSQIAVCPIKMAEYMLCGIPPVATMGVGDVAECLDSSTGVLLAETSDRALRETARNLIERKAEGLFDPHTIRARGEAWFSIKRVEELYQPVFERVFG